MNQRTDTSTLIKVAIQAAVKAGKEILDVYNSSNFGLQFKSDNSPLTIADKRAHTVIVEFLRSTNIPILSEEGRSINYSERKMWKLFWLVDPLDGTKEFVKRNDEFTVNIALINGDSPIAGVVYVPVTKEVYWADKNGSFKAGVKNEKNVYTNIQKLPRVNSRTNFVVVGSRTHMSKETEAFIKSIDSYGKPIEIKSKGSSLKICMVAEGNADVYPRLAPTMEWDTAAGHAIALFAGKQIYQYKNKRSLKYNKENLVNPWFVVE